eukprot:gene25131-biopygen20952
MEHQILYAGIHLTLNPRGQPCQVRPALRQCTLFATYRVHGGIFQLPTLEGWIQPEGVPDRPKQAGGGTKGGNRQGYPSKETSHRPKQAGTRPRGRHNGLNKPVAKPRVGDPKPGPSTEQPDRPQQRKTRQPRATPHLWGETQGMRPGTTGRHQGKDLSRRGHSPRGCQIGLNKPMAEPRAETARETIPSRSPWRNQGREPGDPSKGTPHRPKQAGGETEGRKLPYLISDVMTKLTCRIASSHAPCRLPLRRRSTWADHQSPRRTPRSEVAIPALDLNRIGTESGPDWHQGSHFLAAALSSCERHRVQLRGQIQRRPPVIPLASTQGASITVDT